jgi:hypothetical protein
MSINLENDDGSPVDGLCHQSRDWAVQNLSQVNAFRGKGTLDLRGETPEIYWRHVHSALEHIPSCQSCTSWVKSLYVEVYHNPVASTAKKLYDLVELKNRVRTKRNKSEKELKERDDRSDQYCCLSMFRAVEAEHGYTGLKIVLGRFRDENKWVFTWKDSKTAITNTVYCPWCGEKLPDKAFVE